MSKQSDMIPQVVQIVADCGVPVGLLLGGSVALGCERHDSDLDFFAIADAPRQPELPGFRVFSEKNGCKVLERVESQFPIHVACWTTSSMDDILETKPYMMHPLLQGRIVHDPKGIWQRYGARIERYFCSRPRLAEAWAQQLRDLRDSRSGSVAELTFPQWSDFIRHIEDAFSNEIAEQGVGD